MNPEEYHGEVYPDEINKMDPEEYYGEVDPDVMENELNTILQNGKCTWQTKQQLRWLRLRLNHFLVDRRSLGNTDPINVRLRAINSRRLMLEERWLKEGLMNREGD